MRRVSGEEGKENQGQEISQTLTWNLLMQLISIATLLSADTEFNWRGKGHPVHLMFIQIRNPDLTR